MLLLQIEDVSLKTFYSLLTGVSAFGVLAVVFWLIVIKGTLITRREFDAQKKLADEWKAEAEKWESMAFRSLGNREQIERRDAVITVAVEKAVSTNKEPTP